MSGAYYNEMDVWAAQLLRNLIKAGHIAPGDVDTRSIEDVKPDDIRNYTQHHFFAGAGVWSAALRKAGWHDDEPVCTMSCPCQPFSSAGEGNGFADERHLWPHAYHLIGQLRPERIYGEQVASKAVDAWLDLVHADMEGLGYAFGACAFPSAGVGAPHIRDRTYWLADADNQGPQGYAGHDGAAGWGGSSGSIAASGVFGGVGNTSNFHTWRGADNGRLGSETCAQCGETRAGAGSTDRVTSAVGGVADTDGRPDGRQSDIVTRSNVGGLAPSDGSSNAGHDTTNPTNGQWRDADWLLCRDGKWRPVEPGTFPLAHGAASRVGRLRAYGNACNLEAAYEFIMATRDY